MKEKGIEFVGKILDNVHGFIEYTEAEDKIMHLLLFKRLQSIKQLSLVNWLWCSSVLFSNEADVIAAKEWIESQIIINELTKK